MPLLSARALRRVELWLIATGILVVWAAAVLVTPPGTNVWLIGLVAAVGVGIPSGALAWIFHLQQRLARDAAISEVREMMSDRVKNQLAVIGMCTPMTQDRDAFEIAVGGINASISEIQSVVDNLSSEAIMAWKRHYREALAGAAVA